MGCSSSNVKSKTSVETPSFPKLGLKLSAFDDFIEKCGGYEAIKDYSTNDICYRYIKHSDNNVFPKSYKCEQSYCSYLQKIQSNKVGVANVFISHAWTYKFVDSVKALKSHFKGNCCSNVILFI